MNVWPPGYHLVLRDDVLDLKLPLEVVVDEPLSFQPEDGMELSEEQVQEIIEKTGTEGCQAAISVGDTFGVLREYLSELMLQGAGAGNKEEARRLGKVVAIASYFDAGVDYLRQHWAGVFAEAGGYLGREGDLGCAESQAQLIADLVSKTLDPKLHLITVDSKRAAESSELAAIGVKKLLTLTEVTKILNVSDNTLRDKGLLNDRDENGFDPARLNGTRKSKNAKAGWQFHVEEVERYARLFNPGEGSSDDGVEIRGT